MKKVLSIILVLCVVFSFYSCGDKEKSSGTKNMETSAKASGDGVLVTLICDESGLGDNGYNDNCWKGLEKAKENFGIDIECLVVEEENYKKAFNDAIAMESSLIVSTGQSAEQVVLEIVPANKDTKFLVLDSTNESLSKQATVVSFNEKQGSYLAGVVAGLTTKSNIVSFIGGEATDVIKNFEYGFTQGVVDTNPDAHVTVGYVNSFSDINGAKTIASAHGVLGADVVYCAAGAAGKGVMDAAKDKGFKVIGVDIDQSFMAPKNVLCSMIKKTDVAIYDEIRKFVSGELENGKIEYSLADGGIGISDKAGNLPEDVVEKVKEINQQIVDGKIKVTP